jgi:hypothetical protein
MPAEQNVQPSLTPKRFRNRELVFQKPGNITIRFNNRKEAHEKEKLPQNASGFRATPYD